MDTTRILNDLRVEFNRIQQAIAALEALDGVGITTAAPKTQANQFRGRRKGITAAGRKRLSQLAKARWAARRKQAAKPATKKTAHKPMSMAARKRLSALMKAKWAKRKKAAKA